MRKYTEERSDAFEETKEYIKDKIRRRRERKRQRDSFKYENSDGFRPVRDTYDRNRHKNEVRRELERSGYGKVNLS